jgi:hypothetical protein
MLSPEDELIRDVDAGFPYADPAGATALIKRAVAISPNAAFTIPYELAVRPRSAAAEVDEDTLLLLLEIWSTLFRHPLTALVRSFAELMIRGRTIGEAETLAAMDAIAKHQGQYQALNVAYFSQRPPGPAVDAAYDRIQAEWTAEGT